MANQAVLSDWVAKQLRHSTDRIVITGAGGWLGLATLELLANAIGDGWADRTVCFGSSHRILTLRGGECIAQQPLADIVELSKQPTMVLHLAFLTKDKVDDMAEVDYVAANRLLSQTVLGALDRIGTKAVFIASSGAARYADDPNASAAMRLYGSLKKQDEDDFATWADAQGKTAVIARIFNVAGPYINKHAAYAIASFILDALNGHTIKVKAPHRVVRGTVAIRELMSLVFARLSTQSGTVERFDSGGEALELDALAQRVARCIGPIAVERAAITSERVDEYVGNSLVYNNLLTENEIEIVTLESSIRETAQYLAGTTLTRRTGDLS